MLEKQEFVHHFKTGHAGVSIQCNVWHFPKKIKP